MSWKGNERKKRLPGNWESIRLQVLEDAGWVCELRMTDRCVGTASEVDHVVAGDDHRPESLQAACGPCHAKKSSMEGVAARRRKAEQRLRKRDERHPGEL